MHKINITTQIGAVTFLDVLGWKGIWQRDKSAIYKLQNIVDEMQKKSKDICNEYINNEYLSGKSNPIKILSISDTIAIFTPSPPKVAIEINAKLCSWILEYSLKQELPLRGAISYGEYSISNNIMLGYAVDEAASWHETTDWIGVILTPSAKISLKSELPKFIIKYNNIPFKKNMKNLNLCVKWNFNDDEILYKIISRKGPHVPEIAPKYLNTLEFLQKNN